MKMLKKLAATAVALAAMAGVAQADVIVPADETLLGTPTTLGGGPAVMASTSGCADSGFCTLTELLSGGSISAGGLTFGGFSLDNDPLDGYSQWDTDNVIVQVFDFGGVLMLDYDFAPNGFGDLGSLATLLADFGTGLIDLSYQVVGDGTVDVVAAWLYDLAGAGTSNANYELQADMLIESGGSELAYLYQYLLLENNSVVESDVNDFAGFAGVDSLSITNSLSHLSSQGLNLIYYVDQVFFTEVREVPVPAPMTLGLLGLGLLAFAAQRQKRQLPN
ncbi:MAG: PEP-CTERM sorting domain-containing protein [Permianibacter sp.]